MVGLRQGTTIRGLPIEERIELYDQAMELRRTRRWGKVRIGNYFKIHPSTVAGWLYRGSNPRKVSGGYFNEADTRDSPQLAYIAGAILGDGYLQKNQYRLGLRAKDEDFVRLVKKELRKIVSGNISFYISEENGSKMYRVTTTCHGLYRWFEKWENMVEIAKKFPAEFIRGLADAEGSISLFWDEKERKERRYLSIANTNKFLIEFVRGLARRFDIDFKLRRLKSGVYYLYIQDKKNISKFNRHIGFSIARKKEKLTRALGGERS